MIYKLILVVLFFTLFPLIIRKYNNTMIKKYKNNYSCCDKMNKKLIKIYKFNGCWWNIIHIFIYCILCFLIDAQLNLNKHLLVFIIGLFWFVLSPYKEQGHINNKCNDTVYNDTFKPRRDDIFFNSLGQLLYVILFVIKIKLLN